MAQRTIFGLTSFIFGRRRNNKNARNTNQIAINHITSYATESRCTKCCYKIAHTHTKHAPLRIKQKGAPYSPIIGPTPRTQKPERRSHLLTRRFFNTNIPPKKHTKHVRNKKSRCISIERFEIRKKELGSVQFVMVSLLYVRVCVCVLCCCCFYCSVLLMRRRSVYTHTHTPNLFFLFVPTASTYSHCV